MRVCPCQIETMKHIVSVSVGASSGALLGLVLRQAAKLVSIGICLGLVGAMLLARSIASLLYGISPFDAATIASVSLVLAAGAFLASYIPARPAAKIDPMVALRYE
jgi:ABC-type antimicrobial peptide transport system permease subunit